VHLVGFRPDAARKLSANLYDIYHCCVYSEKLLIDFYSKNKFETLVLPVGFIIRIYITMHGPQNVKQ